MTRVIRWEAARTLGTLVDARAVAPLIAVLDDVNEGVRLEAVKALGQLHNGSAIGPLIAVFGDSNTIVRQ